MTSVSVIVPLLNEEDSLDELYGKLKSMAEKIEGTEAQAEAAQAFDDLDFDAPSKYHVELDEAPVQKELDVDAALEELKRRMGEE